MILCALAAIGTCGIVRAENWPGWRGPDRSGVSSETNLPTTWTDSDNVKWKVALPGSGIASPIVWGNRVFVTESDGHRLGNLHVMCLDRETGREVWHQQFWGTAPTLYHQQKSSMATPVPVTDGKNVFAFFGTGDVVCLTVDGELLWHRSLATEFGPFENRFAASSSPLLFDDLLIVQCDHYGASYLVAIDQHTGADRWKVDRPECWLSWSSPQLIRDNKSGRRELLALGSHKLDAFDPQNGAKLWTVRGMSRECIPTPVFGDGLIYAVSGPKYPTFAIRPGGSGDVTDSNVVWSNPRGGPFVPSPLFVDGRYYLVDDSGIATCISAATGKLLWQKRLPGRYTASPVAGAGNIYFSNEDGMTTVIASGESKYRETARSSIADPVFASLAISQGSIFIRSATQLYRIDQGN
ncbi:MAG: PQQ-binding-like beta-propeller repeat protein [Planctomycetaceae bacterium]